MEGRRRCREKISNGQGHIFLTLSAVWSIFQPGEVRTVYQFWDINKKKNTFLVYDTRYFLYIFCHETNL
jgi:hypothetical protein